MAPTFASAAAAQNQAPPRENAEWLRRPNGATQTFRRQSGPAPTLSSTQQSENTSSAQSARYVPPHRNGLQVDYRYSKEQLLDIYKSQQSSNEGMSDGLSDLYIGGWHPDIANGGGSSGWGRSEANRDAQPGPEICWDREGTIQPLGLEELDEEERELFTTSVNTPLKAPTVNKDTQQSSGLGSRRMSIPGHAANPGGNGPLSPSLIRGAGRRRDTSESYQFPTNPLSPTGATPGREEQRTSSPPPSLTRRRTDLKDPNGTGERSMGTEERSAGTSYTGIKRTTTGPLSAGFGAPPSPWANTTQGAGVSPMGSFGNFGSGPQGAQSDKRQGGTSGRAESRFMNLLNKDSNEDTLRSVERKTSMSSLSRLNENESWVPQQARNLAEEPLEESDEEESDDNENAEAAAPIQPPSNMSRGLGMPTRADHRTEHGFGAFGMTGDSTGGFGQGLYQAQQAGGHEAMSPTGTNPYQSPEQRPAEHHGHGMESNLSDMHNTQLSGLGGFGNDPMQGFGGFGGLGALPNLGRPSGFADALNDRSQTSSAGTNRGFSGLGGMGLLGGMPGTSGWPVSHGGLGTPGRQASGFAGAFGSNAFAGGMPDLQSPGLPGLGGGNLMSPGAASAASRMASMFPPNLQDQMRAERDQSGERSLSGLGESGRLGEGSYALRELSNNQSDQERSVDEPSELDTTAGLPSQQFQYPTSSLTQGRPSSSSASNQPPAPQQRTMVMPDRMRWIYRDPQGQTQGPWSGLEMHDWYKAGFFSPELLVKKYEDPEYEPLAQLIRRIGNSREPFLVPQIGIPHGAVSSNGPNAWAAAGSVAPPSAAGGAQPPFASSFPSFGTTLTAEQQNALERRKQEEQYLMARQKEHLAQAQIAQRIHQGHHGGMQHHSSNLLLGQGQLHHHASAQSLHSQPSFGSLTSPNMGPYQSSPGQGPQGQAPGFFDKSIRAPGASAAGNPDNLGQIREEEIPGIMDRLDLGNRAAQGQYGAPGQPSMGHQGTQSQMESEGHDRQIQQMYEDRARLQQEQDLQDAAYQGSGGEASNERLLQFQQLQGKLDARFQATMPQLASGGGSSAMESSVGSPAGALQGRNDQAELSLQEQVQNAASVQQSPVQAPAGHPQPFPKPFPPAPSQSPLPAPAAQRTGRQSVADQLQTEQRDLSQTPSTETPSAIAPWARDTTETQRAPSLSLKEIQDIEAKQAAQAEQIAAAARRAALARQVAEAQTQAVPAAPGLPASASWAGNAPAASAASNAAAWAKAAQKHAAPATAKSMAQIQKEEEARKKKLAVAAASVQGAATGTVATTSGGKSYANLAGKVGGLAGPNPVGGAWTTVGTGGKTKPPVAPSAAAPVRSVSSGVGPAAQPAAAAVRKAPIRSSTTSNGGVNAQDEFRKWATGELRPDLNKGISAEEFVINLVALPQDAEMITEAVHGASSTIDSRHFAEEFIRRKKMADKGLVDTSMPQKSASPLNAGVDKSGGWSEVAKKGPPGKEVGKEESNGNFRVVASKRKGSKK